MSDRYKEMFSRLEKKAEGAFIPFCVLGDPDRDSSLNIIRSLIEGGADALELGIPFSDPIADGPIIQKAGQRALDKGFRVKEGFEIISLVRRENPDIPIGVLVYANLVENRGRTEFFPMASGAGVDSVLIADIPIGEIGPYKKAAEREGIKIVLILPMDADEKTMIEIAKTSDGYLYLVSRSGVTGIDSKPGMPSANFMKKLKKLGSAPPVLGFGISSPDDVKAALLSGCHGAIAGSAIVQKIEEGNAQDLFGLVQAMKAATSG